MDDRSEIVRLFVPFLLVIPHEHLIELYKESFADCAVVVSRKFARENFMITRYVISNLEYRLVNDRTVEAIDYTLPANAREVFCSQSKFRIFRREVSPGETAYIFGETFYLAQSSSQTRCFVTNDSTVRDCESLNVVAKYEYCSERDRYVKM